MTAENLNTTLVHMLEETKKGRLKWTLDVLTSEYKDAAEKPVVEADEKQWTVDECYVDYHCDYHGTEFAMITYENIEKSGEEVRSTNLVFLPSILIRRFDLDELAPFAIEVSPALIQTIHHLWETLLELRKENETLIEIKVNE